MTISLRRGLESGAGSADGNGMSRHLPAPRWLLVIVSVAALALVACDPSPAPRIRPRIERGSDGAKPAVPAEGAYFGFWMKPQKGGWSKRDRKMQWGLTQHWLGRSLDIAHEYHTFFDRFPTWWERWNISRGRTPLISWNGTSSSAVRSGRHDDLVRTRARAVRNLDAPVFLRYFWEPEAKKKLAITESPQAYIDAWRRIHDIFEAEGADNAAFVWCPTAWGFKTGEAQRYYPGDDVVDWICADGYNWGSSRGYDAWAEWSEIFGAFHDFGTAHDKPLMIGEWGSVEGAPGEKAAWYRNAREAIKQMPGIKALVYFNSHKYEAREGTRHDWRIASSASSYSAFRKLANDPYFDP